MLGYLSVNGTLTFKKSYDDGDYYDLEYLFQNTKKHKGNAKLKAKKGKGSRTYTMNRRAKKRIENATILMRHHQDKKNYTIKMLTLTFAQKPKEANKKVSAFFNRIMKEKIIENYWWVKEYHPEHYKNTGEKKEKTEWHRVVVFNEGLVNVVQQYLKKGAQVYVEGQLSTRKWKDEQSGQDKYSTEILIQGYNSSLTMLGGGNQNSIPSQDNKQNFDDNSIAQNDMDDDIPF